MMDPNRDLQPSAGCLLGVLIALTCWALLVAFVIHYHLLSS